MQEACALHTGLGDEEAMEELLPEVERLRLEIEMEDYSAEEAVTHWEEQLENAQQVEDLEAQGVAHVRLSQAYEEVGNVAMAHVHMQKTCALYTGLGDEETMEELLPEVERLRLEMEEESRKQEAEEEQMAILARTKAEHVEMLPKIEARWREQREKQAEINRKQEEEENVLGEKIKELKETAKTPEQEREEQIQRKVHRENRGKILCCAERNNVVKFNLESFDPKDPHTGRMEGQYAGNHFTLAITLFGFIQLLSIIQWDTYKRDEKKFWDKEKNVCWNIGELNGYDVCQHVKEYLQKIEKLHQSLLEVIMEGVVEELKCLREYVGLADAFFSHVQALPIATMLETLEDAGTRFAKELLHDPVATAALRKKALEEFLEEKGRDDAAPLIAHYKGDWGVITQDLHINYGSAPALASITAQKDTGAPKFFIDYCGIRQCVSSDFTIARVVGAIETVGTTVVELDADVLGPDALLKRIFCVLESFATIKANGVLLVCGPGLQDPAQMLKLAELASDSVECKAVMDSLTAKCRWEDEAIKIKAYIQRTVGFSRTDKVVLGAIVRCILDSTESVFAERADGGAAVLGAIGWMVFETGDYPAALGLLKAALAKGEAAYGAEAADIADVVCRIGWCLGEMGGGIEEEKMQWFERDLRIQAKAHGSEEHASTARSLVSMGKTHGADDDEAKRIECCERAIQRIQADAHPEDYADDRADALEQIGAAHFHKQEWQACLEWSQRSAEVRAAKHGPDHALAAAALGTMAIAHGKLGDPEQAMALQLRVLGIEERAQGPLSREAGITCRNIGVNYCNKDDAEATAWFVRMVEAFEYTLGPAHYETKAKRDILRKWCVEKMDPAHPKAQEHSDFLAASEERARLAAQ
jgi:hypothetical protein